MASTNRIKFTPGKSTRNHRVRNKKLKLGALNRFPGIPGIVKSFPEVH